MDEQERHDPRPSNDSRTRIPPEASNVAPIGSTPGVKQGWRDGKPSWTMLVWACVASVALTMLLGFTWGGWVSAGNSLKAGETMGQDAVVLRLAPLCVNQFNQDPDKVVKLAEMREKSAYQRSQYVQDQGWATVPGEETADRRVADACVRLLMEMTP